MIFLKIIRVKDINKQKTTMEPEQAQPEQAQEVNTTYATYTNYTNERLLCTAPEQKTVPNTGPNSNPPSPPQIYHQIPIMYNFGTKNVRNINDCFIEGCEMETPFGIQSKTSQNGRDEHSVMCRFDIGNQEHNRWIETINQLHMGCAAILQQNKGLVKFFNFNAQMAEATGLKNPIYRPKDQVTGEPIQGRSPSMFLKLFSRGTPPMGSQTLFTDLSGTPISWKLLQNVIMKFIPLIHVKRIYVGGGKASIQMEVVSAIVTSVTARGSTTMQTSTLHRLQAIRPELADSVAAQLAKLTLDRQDQMLGSSKVDNSENSNNEAEHSDAPTFSGIVPGAPHARQPVMAVQSPPPLPTISQLGGGQVSMQDFTSGAPQRTIMIPEMNRTPSPTTMQFN